jgi:hypothetical protein
LYLGIREILEISGFASGVKSIYVFFSFKKFSGSNVYNLNLGETYIPLSTDWRESQPVSKVYIKVQRADLNLIWY